MCRGMYTGGFREKKQASDAAWNIESLFFDSKGKTFSRTVQQWKKALVSHCICKEYFSKITDREQYLHKVVEIHKSEN